MGHPADAYDHVPDRPGHDLRYSNNTTKLRTELAWHPNYDFDTGLAATITWYRENPTWWKPAKSTTEAKYKLLGR
jgi:dTDP-glucose 4,6-dehydratase